VSRRRKIGIGWNADASTVCSGTSAAGSTGVYISLVVVLILLYSGWKGGDLVYRHGMGVNDTRT
jgi:uncharacterized membrane protein